MKIVALTAGLAVLVAPAAAAAQDFNGFAAVAAAAVEGLGQSLAESMHDGQSLFVTATGRADLPAPITDAYLVNIEGRSSSAVEAQRLRDERLTAARAAAARYGVSVEVGSTAFTREIDVAAQQKRRNQLAADRAAHPGIPIVDTTVPDGDRVFVARTGVRFRAADPQRLPVFLDALLKVGVDSPSGALGAPVPGAGLFGRTEVLGFGMLDKLDPAVWDRASQDAVTEARRQAAVLAQASGRSLGPVRQVLMLTRSVQGGGASVTVAVRFAFAGGQ